MQNAQTTRVELLKAAKKAINSLASAPTEQRVSHAREMLTKLDELVSSYASQVTEQPSKPEPKRKRKARKANPRKEAAMDAVFDAEFIEACSVTYTPLEARDETPEPPKPKRKARKSKRKAKRASANERLEARAQREALVNRETRNRKNAPKVEVVSDNKPTADRPFGTRTEVETPQAEYRAARKRHEAPMEFFEAAGGDPIAAARAAKDAAMRDALELDEPVGMDEQVCMEDLSGQYTMPF